MDGHSVWCQVRGLPFLRQPPFQTHIIFVQEAGQQSAIPWKVRPVIGQVFLFEAGPPDASDHLGVPSFRVSRTQSFILRPTENWDRVELASPQRSLWKCSDDHSSPDTSSVGCR